DDGIEKVPLLSGKLDVSATPIVPATEALFADTRPQPTLITPSQRWIEAKAVVGDGVVGVVGGALVVVVAIDEGPIGATARMIRPTIAALCMAFVTEG